MIVEIMQNSGGGIRTPDPTVNSRLLYQLSYSGMQKRHSPRNSFRPSASPPVRQRRQSLIPPQPLRKRYAAAAISNAEAALK